MTVESSVTMRITGRTSFSQRADSTRNNQMAGGKHKNISNRNQDYLASSEPNSSTTASPGYTITPEEQDLNVKSLLMLIMGDFKEDLNNSLKKIEDKTIPGRP